MPRFITPLATTLATCTLATTLTACVVAPQPAPRPGPTPQQIADQRLHQVDGRIDNLSRRIDAHVNQGYYPPPQGGALHHRLDVIRQESRDMSAQHGGGLSGEEARVLNQELDNAAHAIGE